MVIWKSWCMAGGLTREVHVTTVHRNASARRRKPAERQSLELADELHGGGDICLGWVGRIQIVAHTVLIMVL
jgi:hypothetical protein